MAKLSTAQEKALAEIRAQYAALDAAERKNWGKAYTGWVDMSGTNPRTLHALADAGLIVFRGERRTHSEQRRGAFGRTAGMGTRLVASVQLLVRPA